MASSCSSDSEPDDAFAADMEALQRACMLAGTDPTDAGASSSAHVSYHDTDSDLDSGSTESSGGNDLGLLRRLTERFTLPSPAMDSACMITASCSSNMPSGETDEDDDFETLRAIQRRFTKYESDSMSRKSEKITAEPASADSDISGPRTPNRCAELSKEHGQKLLDHEAHNLNVRDLMSSKFPKSAQNFVDALKKNRSCQKFLRRKLLEIEAKIERNKELKERVKCLMDFQVVCKRKVNRTICQKKDPRVTLISAKKPMPEPSSKTALKKVHALCLGPDENVHVSNYRMVLERFPISLSKQPWSKAENENLTKGIKQQYQEMLLLNSMNMESEGEGIMVSNLIMPKSADIELTPESIRSFIPLVNWNRLASMYLKGRSGSECLARWLNCEDPIINHDPWTAMEDKKLLFILQDRGICNWIDISISLGTHRTPFQSLARYQRSLNPHILNKEWTEAEDVKLRAAVDIYGDKNWQMVASCVEGRTGTQCSNRWRTTLNPKRQKVGRWSVDEDKRLKIAVTLFGARNWSKIAHFIPGRTQVQCRERWLNCLDPTLNLKPWTAEEDAKLLDAFAIHGNCWSKIAACILPRTDSQCRRRWKILLPEEVLMLKAAAKIKKTALIGNFVGRESERPAIGPNDFTSLTVHGNVAGVKVKKRKRSTNQPEKLRGKPRRDARNLKMCPSSTDPGPSDLAPPPNVQSAKVVQKNHKPRKPRVKSQRLVEGNLRADGMVNASSDAAAVTVPPESAISLNAMESSTPQKNHNRSSKIIKRTRRKKSTPIRDNQPEMPEEGAESSLKRSHMANNMVDASVETIPADVHLLPGSNASNAMESISNPNRTTKRKRQSARSRSRDAVTSGIGGDNLVSGEDSSIAENPPTNKMQPEEPSRTMLRNGIDVAHGDDDSSLLITCYEEAKRKRRRIVTEEAADPSKKKVRNTVGRGAVADDDNTPLIVLLHEKGKQKCAVTEDDAKVGGEEVDDSSLLYTFYRKAKKILREKKRSVTVESRPSAKD